MLRIESEALTDRGIAALLFVKVADRPSSSQSDRDPSRLAKDDGW